MTKLRLFIIIIIGIVALGVAPGRGGSIAHSGRNLQYQIPEYGDIRTRTVESS